MRVSAYWDGTEANIARLLLDDGEKIVHWPVHCLPKGAKVGEWLSFDIFLDHEKQEKEMNEIERLRLELMEKKYENN